MPKGPTQPLVTECELDAARLGLIRQRLITFGYVVGLLIIFLLVVRIIGLRWLGRAIRLPEIIAMFGSAFAGIVVMVVPRRRARRARVARSTLRQLVRRTQIMVVAAVVSQFQGTQQLAEILNNLLRPLGFEGRLGPAMPMYLFFGLVHFCASLVMPWTWKEAGLPVAGIAIATSGCPSLPPATPGTCGSSALCSASSSASQASSTASSAPPACASSSPSA
jgi:hypothetical protein